MPRDEFAARTVQVLALRAAHVCSNPDCRAPTAGASAQRDKAVITGEACHITAASTGGPRFDAELTSESRRGIENGIWLCSTCSKRVDSDVIRYPASLLRKWKAQHDEWTATREVVPTIPHFALNTVHGLSLPTTAGASVTGADVKDYREHHVQVSNPNRIALDGLDIEFNLPEAVIQASTTNRPAGTEVLLAPIRPQLVVNTTGSGKVQRQGSPHATGHFSIRISTLPAKSMAAVNLLTSITGTARAYFESQASMMAALGDDSSGAAMHWLRGKFHFDLRGESVERMFIGAIAYDESLRLFRLSQVNDDVGDIRVWQGTLGP